MKKNLFRFILLSFVFTLLSYPTYLYGEISASRNLKVKSEHLINNSVVLIYDKTEIKNDKDWFGVWHLQPLFEKMGYKYFQSPYNELDENNLYTIYICYFEDEKIKDFEKLRRILYRAWKNNRKVFFIGSMGAYFSGKWLDYNHYNRIFNFAGVEDRGMWSDKVDEMKTKFDLNFFHPEFTRDILLKNCNSFRSLFPISNDYLPIVESKLNGNRYTPVVITKIGGIILNPFLVGQLGKEWKVAIDFKKYFDVALKYGKNSTNGEKKIDRKISVLFSSKDQRYFENTFVNHYQRELNLYGYDYDYIDVSNSKNLDPNSLHDIILTAFISPNLENYSEVLDFLTNSHAKKYMFMGYLPFFDKSGNSPEWDSVDRFFKRFNINFEDFKDVNKDCKIVYNKKYYPFEMKISPKNISYAQLTTKDTNAVKIVSIRDGNKFYTPFYYDDKILIMMGDWAFNNDKYKYYFNFFEIFKDFLKPQIYPIYQYGYGPRYAFSHIDGDGFMNSRVPHPEVMGAENIYSLIKNINFPMSISFIVSEIVPEYKGRLYNIELAQKIVDLPQVELASHTLTHPFMWKYDPNVKTNAVGYTIKPVKLTQEVDLSLSLLNRYLHKNSKLLFFSGDCEPTESQLRYVREKGVIALNGKDTVFDKKKHFYFYDSPPYQKIGKEVQINAGVTNENIFTNLWAGPMDGYKNVIDTFKNTNYPYKLNPIDVYYHFYSGAQKDAFRALKIVWNWVLKQKVSPIFVTDYLHIIHDWINLKIFKGDNYYKIENDGYVRTIKLMKNKKVKFIDLNKSKNLIGFKEYKEYFDIYLDNNKIHKIYFSDKKVKNPPCISYLTHACFKIMDLKKEKIYKFKGFGHFELDMSGLNSRKKYMVSLIKDGEIIKVKRINHKKDFTIKDDIREELIMRLEEKE